MNSSKIIALVLCLTFLFGCKDEPKFYGETYIISKIETIQRTNPDLAELEYNGLNVHYVNDYFNSHPTIKKLYLIGRDTDKIPDNISKLDSLEELEFILDKKPNASLLAVFKIRSVKKLTLKIKEMTAIPKEISHLKNLTCLDISWSDVKEIPPEIGKLQKLAELNIEHTSIETIPKALNGLHLKRLNVSECKIKTNEFQKCNSLLGLKVNEVANWNLFVKQLDAHSNVVNLEMSKNNLDHVPAVVFQLPKLEKLNLSSNQLEKAKVLDFGKLRMLRSLDLAANELSQSTFRRLSFPNHGVLETLDLSFNRLTEINERITALTGLRRLVINDNEIKSVPNHIGRLKSLRAVDLSSNQIATLSNAVAELKNLDSLDISFNYDINNSFVNIFSIDSLKCLKLNGLDLLIVPDAITKLHRLQALELNFNQLEKLPNGFEALQSLNTLQLNNNNLKTIPPSIGKLAALQMLMLNENKIGTINIGFDKLQKLDYLDIGQNEIKSIPVNFSMAKAMRALTISGNPLNKPVEDLEVISKLKNLETFTAINCNIDKLPPEILNLTKLNWLDLSENKIDNIDEISKRMASLQILTLENPKTGTGEEPAISIFFRILALIIGIFLLYESFFLYKNEQGAIENKIDNFWLFMAEKDSERKGFFFWARNFTDFSAKLIYRLFDLQLKSLQTWGVIASFNAAFLSFYYLTSFVLNVSGNNFLNPKYLFCVAFLALAFSPLYFRRFSRFILICCALLVVGFFAVQDQADLAANLPVSFLMLFVSSLVTYLYLYIINKIFFQRRSTAFLKFLLLLFDIVLIAFFIYSIFSLALIAFFSKSEFLWYLFYFSLSLNTIFIVSVVTILFYFILILHHLIERSSYIIIEHKILSNKKIAVPVGILLISISSFLNDYVMSLLEKIVKLFI